MLNEVAAIDYHDLFTAKDEGEFLNYLFIIKKNKNPRVSIRAFAKQLGISHSHLLNILTKKKKLTYATALKITKKCNFEVAMKVYFLDLIEGLQNSLSHKVNINEVIKNDYKGFYSTWLNPLIISLAGVANFKLTPQKFSKLLEVPLLEVEAAFENLVSLCLIQKNTDGFYERLMVVSFLNRNNVQEMNRFHGMMLQKVSEKLSVISNKDRAVSTFSFTCKESHFKEMQEKIFNFVARLVDEAKTDNHGTEPDTLYIISTQLVPFVNLRSNEG